MSNAEFYQTAAQSQSSSSSSNSSSQHRSHQHCGSHRCRRTSHCLLLCVMTMATLLPLPLLEARHVHAALSVFKINPLFGFDRISSSGSSENSDSYDLNDNYGNSYDSSIYEELSEPQEVLRHKRHHGWDEFKAVDPITTAVWENPCGGVYRPIAQDSRSSDISDVAPLVRRKNLNNMLDKVSREYEIMRLTAPLNYCNHCQEDWKYKQNQFNFLPNITLATRKVELKNWYLDMQVFMGSFLYLGQAEYKYNKRYQLRMGDTVNELSELLQSARRVLCEIETTINASYPLKEDARLKVMNTTSMSNRLKFKTDPSGRSPTEPCDLLITKHLYMQFLYTITHRPPRPRASQERRYSMERMNSMNSMERKNSKQPKNSMERRNRKEPKNSMERRKQRRNSRERTSKRSMDLSTYSHSSNTLTPYSTVCNR